MKKMYNSPSLEIVETIARYCAEELTVSSGSLGDHLGGGNEDIDFGGEYDDLN